MYHISFSLRQMVLLTVIILICVHWYPLYKRTKRQQLLQETPSVLPARVNTTQKAYLYAEQSPTEAIALRKQVASGSVENGYNLGTLLAMSSVASGVVTDQKLLAEAETYLSGATSFATPAHEHLLHNLATVRELLDEHTEQNAPQDQQNTQQQNTQQDQQQSGETQQEQEQENQGGAGKQEQGATSTAPLSASMKQQLEQYQAQLLREQAQNQQFFDKNLSQTEQNDPFGALEQLFGGTPQFDTSQNSGTKDW